MSLIQMVLALLGSLTRDRVELAAENPALRQQLAILREKKKPPRLRQRDRIFWAILSRAWSNWRSALLIVQPETMVRWHRRGLEIFWRWKSRAKRGCPAIDIAIRKLIRRMSRENPFWGTPRIQSEFALLGYIAAESTIDNRQFPNTPSRDVNHCCGICIESAIRWQSGCRPTSVRNRRSSRQA